MTAYCEVSFLSCGKNRFFLCGTLLMKSSANARVRIEYNGGSLFAQKIMNATKDIVKNVYTTLKFPKINLLCNRIKRKELFWLETSLNDYEKNFCHIEINRSIGAKFFFFIIRLFMLNRHQLSFLRLTFFQVSKLFT